MVFDRKGAAVSVAQKEHRQIYPKPGWVEHDPLEIISRTREVVAEGMERRGLAPGDLAAIGITNQRETTVVWDRNTGEPVYNALVWQDTRVAEMVAELARDGGQDRFRAQTGLPLATYFSAAKIRWILDNVAGARRRAEAGELAFGNIDTYLAWHLTGAASKASPELRRRAEEELMDARDHIRAVCDSGTVSQLDSLLKLLPELR